MPTAVRSTSHVAHISLLFFLGLALLWPLFVWSGLTCDDFMYLRFVGHSAAAWADLPGARSRPLTTWGMVALLAADPDARWLLPGLRLLQHVGNSWLVGVVGRQAFGLPTRTARLVAVAFLVWGSHSEVFYYSALHDLTAATFVLLALTLAPRVARRGHLIALAAIAALAYASKESAWPLPLLVALLPSSASCATRRPDRPSRWAAAWACAGSLVAVLSLRTLVGVAWRGQLEPSIYNGFAWRKAVTSVVKLLIRSVVPGAVDLESLASPFRSLSTGSLTALLACLLAVLAAALASRVRGRAGAQERPAIAPGPRSGLRFPAATLWRSLVLMAQTPTANALAAFGVSLAPVCMLSVSTASGENSRYLYLPTALLLLAGAVAFVPGRLAVWARTMTAILIATQATCQLVQAQRWRVAARLADEARTGFVAWAEAHPHARRVAIACVPDSYRGAFAARNVLEHVGSAMDPPRQVIVLATRYVDGPEDSAECTLSMMADGSAVDFVLHAPYGRATLAHPHLVGSGPACMFSFCLTGAVPAGAPRAASLLFVDKRLDRNDTPLLVYGRDLRPNASAL